MLTLLAQTTTPPAGTAEWLAIFIFLLGGVVLVLKIVDHFKAKPPLHSQFADRLETEKRFDDIEAKIEAARVESASQYQQLLAAGETRAVLIHNRINEASNKIGELVGAVNILIKKL